VETFDCAVEKHRKAWLSSSQTWSRSFSICDINF
jgi:hypothetical protein